MSSYKLNYTFQKADSRDYIYQLPVQVAPILAKAATTLVPVIIPFSLPIPKVILDQGDLGSCVSNATAQAINMQTKNTFQMSRLLHYYLGRCMDTTNQLTNLDDTGLNVRQSCKIISKYGANKESVWSYNISQFANLPPLSVFQGIKYFRKYNYVAINQDFISLSTYLKTNNSPIIFGFQVYSSFLTDQVARSGQVPLPNIQTETLEGGHCMIIIGYNATQFICVNCWSSRWGAKGLCYIPQEYLLNSTLASDFTGLQFIW